MFQVPHTMPV